MCVTDEDLSTERFSFLGSGEKLERVIFGEGGFLTVFSHEDKLTLRPVSYTHLDVYKRQFQSWSAFISPSPL